VNPTQVDPLVEYEAALFANRRVFLLNHTWAFFAYRQIHETFTALGLVLSQGRDKDRNSHVGLIPFLLIMQRQSVNAFLSLASLQSFQAWVLLRPCLEACLIAGRWVDDPGNATIWRNRDSDPKAYRKRFEGKALHSASLPGSDRIQTVLKAINDDFLHANPRYYDRHTDMERLDPDSYFLKLEYFDDEQDYLAHTFAFLHLLVFIQESFSEMLAATIADQPKVPAGLSALEGTLMPHVVDFLTKYPGRRRVIEELGVWPLASGLQPGSTVP